MNSLAFLGLAVVLSLLGCLVLGLRRRPPRSMEAHIRDFAAELEALAPDAPRRLGDRGPRPRRGRRSG